MNLLKIADLEASTVANSLPLVLAFHITSVHVPAVPLLVQLPANSLENQQKIQKKLLVPGPALAIRASGE